MSAIKTKKQKKAGPWVYTGDSWFRRTTGPRSGEQAPAHEVCQEVLSRLVNAVAMNCGREEVEQAYGKEIADVVTEARTVLLAIRKE